jgi:lipoprotein signal peptidase
MLHSRSPVSFPSRHSVTTPLSHTGTFLGMTLLVLIGDVVSKSLAVGLWSGERYPLLGRLVLIDVVRNPLGAFSTSLGAYTWEINVGATAAAVVLAMAVCPRLARLDAIAPNALGMIAGAALGNLASLLTSPAGVPDFLAIVHGHGALVLNVADVAAYMGIFCCARLAWTLVRAVVGTSFGRPG